MLFVPETKIADVGKIISLGNLLVRKVMWLVLTTTSATLILSLAFGAVCMARISYIYSRLPGTHALTFFTYRDKTLSLPLSILTSRDSTLSLSLSPLRLTETTPSLVHFSLIDIVHSLSHSLHFDLQSQHTLCDLKRQHTLFLLHFDFQQSTPRKCIHSATFFFLVLPFRLDFFRPRTQPQKFHQTPKEINNQHGRRHMPSSTRCYISMYLTWNTQSTYIL